MFGIIFYIILGIISIAVPIIYWYKDLKERNNANKNCKETYVDAKGNVRNVKNNNLLFRTNINGHQVVVDQNNNIISNLTYERLHLNEKRNFYYNEAIKNGYSTFLFLSSYDLCSSDMYSERHLTKFKGSRYKDIKCDDIYVIREIEYNNKKGYYYININNNHIVREIDNPGIDFKNKLSISDIQYINELIDNNDFYIHTCDRHIEELGRKIYE